MEETMRTFVFFELSKRSDFGELTKGELRRLYLEELKIPDLNKTERRLFSSIVDDVLSELINNNPKMIQQAEDLKANEKLPSVKTNSSFLGDEDLLSSFEAKESDDEIENITQENGTEDHLDRISSKPNNVDYSQQIASSDSSSSDDVVEAVSLEHGIKGCSVVLLDVCQDSAQEKNFDSESTSANNKRKDYSSEDSCDSIRPMKKLKTKKQVADCSDSSSSETDGNFKDKELDDLPTRFNSPGSKNALKYISTSNESSEDEIASSKLKKTPSKMSFNTLKKSCLRDTDSSEDEDFARNVKATKKNSNSNKGNKFSRKSQLERKEMRQDPEEDKDLSSGKENKSSKKSAKKERKKGKQIASENPKIERLKKYLNVAGMRVTSYEKLFKNCSSGRAKCEKLLDMLHEAGLKGHPTIEKCKKLRKKIETRKEVESLDVNNIIYSEKGRSSRRLEAKTNTMSSCSSPDLDHFAQMKDLIDCDMDSPVKSNSRTHHSRIIDSD